MGFFKDMRDLKKLGDHHGGMPSVRGAFQDIRSLADDRGEEEVIQRGVPAKAICKGFPELVPGDRFAMHVPLEIHPPDGGPPYEVDFVYATARMKAPLTVGMELPVKVLPEDPQRVAMQWDAQKGAVAAAGGDQAAVMQGVSAAYGSAADDAYRQSREQQKAEDPVTKLEKLKQMRDAGLITDAEFEAKKSEVLGAM